MVSLNEKVDNALICAKRRADEKSGKGKTDEGAQVLSVEKRDNGKPGFGFYVYENWTAEQKAVVHIGNCGKSTIAVRKKMNNE